MKKSYFLIMITSVFCFENVSAQSQPSYGIRAGLTISDWNGEAVNNMNKLVNVADGLVSTRSRKAFYAGGYMNVPVSATLSVEPGIYFSQKGYTMNGDIEISALKFLGPNATVQMQSSYIDVPVVLKANLVKGLQLFAGPQVSYLLQNNLHLNAGVFGFSVFQRDIDMTDNFKRWDVGLTGGLAYQFGNGFNIQAGYEHGLSRVDANSNFKSYNRVAKVGIGFTF